MKNQILQVLYTCDKCGIKDRKISIIARKGGEDILKWMEKLQTTIGIDHYIKSPHCRIQELTNVKIPINKEGNTLIGGPIR